MNESNQLLAAAPVPKAFFKLAIPAVAAQLINILYNLVDKMFIGHIPTVGKQALAGVGVTTPVILAISAFAALVSMGDAPKASILLGRGKTLVSMGNVAVGAMTNIVLDALFINGFHMGVQGATLATILSQGVSAGFVIRYLCTDKSVLRLRLRNIRFHGKLLWPCILLGTSPALMLMYGREAQSKTKTASPATIPKSWERNRKIHSCMLYLRQHRTIPA